MVDLLAREAVQNYTCYFPIDFFSDRELRVLESIIRHALQKAINEATKS